MKKIKNEKTDSKPHKKKEKGWWGNIFWILLGVVSLKLALTFGFFCNEKEWDRKWLSAPDVLAEEQKNKMAQSSSQNKSTSVATVSPAEKISYLDQKEADLKRKEKEIQQRQEYLQQMERDIEKKLQELTAIQKEIQNFRSEKEANQNAKIRSLAKIYETMKTKEAAKLLENLDEQLVVNVISVMNTDAAANILANMDTKKAAKISQVLSTH
ncbi:MotE family protein [Desulforhabdus amnigena]|jgi:flagellar motility protein MotE (MotC chaperone)|uniref:Magnesium transporter MgtE intracellular domain-containing protein n=1 Tax=Desulforhabdus amnigena TaxID=40218 RepID=A0A9W6D0F6_9BACT|nr:hypothetical protein [Desulforhabdus amnigena]NLJ26605.1 hypothetical protein [Deltaproteobacteria bacterium]GLI33585.1 hypothetical protein DAMNIGENAA_10180 [Desulforhabdus amnigena]